MNTNKAAVRYLVVFNPLPNKKRHKRLTQLKRALKLNDIEFDLYPTDESLTVNQQYFKQSIEHYTDLVILGGDGTFNCVLNCIALNTELRVGLLPAGTGNDFARMWYKGASIKQIIQAVTRTDTQSISLGQCVFSAKTVHNQYQQRRVFHNIMGTGFDSQISKDLQHNKATFRHLTYLLSALKHVPFYREKHTIVNIDNKTERYQNLITAFANGRFFGGGLKIAPNASPMSAALDVVQVARYSLMTKLRLIAALCVGKHLAFEQVNYRQVLTQSSIDSDGLDLQADGEYIGQSPCTISVVENAIKLKVIK